MSAIIVKNLTKTYKTYEKEPGFVNSLKSLIKPKTKEIKAVNDITFKIEEGELVGFIGPNGAGKTTTLKCLSGLLYPTSAKEISVLNYKPTERKTDFLKSISFIMGQKNQLWWDLPPAESFILNKEIYEISDSQYQKTLSQLAELLEVKEVLNIPVKRLSLGQRMKCELIAALLHNPKVLFLDEPTIGLDVVMQNNLREFIRDYNKIYNSTILLTSHYMKDVQALAKRVIVISQGKILFDGQLSTLVKKYSTYKLITIVLKKEITEGKLKSLGEIKLFDHPTVILKVPSNKSNEIAAKILKESISEDLNIEDVDIEEVIRHVFLKSKNYKNEN